MLDLWCIAASWWNLTEDRAVWYKYPLYFNCYEPIIKITWMSMPTQTHPFEKVLKVYSIIIKITALMLTHRHKRYNFNVSWVRGFHFTVTLTTHTHHMAGKYKAHLLHMIYPWAKASLIPVNIHNGECVGWSGPSLTPLAGLILNLN